MTRIILAIILFVISLPALILSMRSFREKGFLLNNAYLYASRQQREAMDKKPYYRQTAIVFLLVSIIFLLNGLSILLDIMWISYIANAVMILTIVYAIASSVAIEKKKK